MAKCKAKNEMRNNPDRAITTLRNNEELNIKSLVLTLKKLPCKGTYR